MEFNITLTAEEADVLLDALVHRRTQLDVFRFNSTINGSVNAEKMISKVHEVEKKIMFTALLAGAKQQGDNNE